MGIISIENTDRLFWLGRYSERVYTTIRLFSVSYDDMIDTYANSYQDFCSRLDIPNIYQGKEHFIQCYCFDGTNPDSIYSNLMRAYDNGITLREEIGSESLSYIQLAVYEMNKAKLSSAPLIELQRVLDNLLAFWGIADDSIDSENVRNIIKVGKRIERLDLYARLQMSREELHREVARLSGRLPRTNLKYSAVQLDSLRTLVQQPEINYREIVFSAEHLIV